MSKRLVAGGAAIALLFSPLPVAATDDGAETVIRAFFTAVDAGQVEEAVAMLAPELTEGAGAKDAWAAQVSAITEVEGVEIGAGEPDGPCITYRVVAMLEVAPEAADAPIPYYGLEQGANTRWMQLCPAGGSWAINAIVTGP
jgi:hypothetical protein